MSMRTPLARRVLAGALMVLLTACQSWQPTAISPQGWTPEERPSSVRATLRSREVITIRDPTVRNDSIVGATEADVGVASRDVRLLEVQRFSADKTLGLVLGAAAVVAAVGLVALLSSYNPGP